MTVCRCGKTLPGRSGGEHLTCVETLPEPGREATATTHDLKRLPQVSDRLWCHTHSAFDGDCATPLLGCVMYLGDGEDDWCLAPAWWRPANIPFRNDEWFCVEHATKIARQQGVWGIYHRNSPDTVEELPDLTPPAREAT